MRITTRLPVATMAFHHWHVDDTEVVVLVAKANFAFHPEAGFQPEQAPPELRVSDEIGDGEEGFAPPIYEQEIAPGKTATDLIIRAVARSPEGQPRSDWAVAVEVPDRLRYDFHVRGPTEWRRNPLGWTTTTPELVHEVPLTYEYAYGGSVPGPDPESPPEVYEGNPAGRGFTTPARLKDKTPLPAAQIGLLAEFIEADPKREMRVCGTMPVGRAWLPRRGAAGTFDEEWERTRHPRMPPDYDLNFWNCAPGVLQFDPYLSGDEQIRLEGVQHTPEPLVHTLPGLGVVADLSGPEGTETLPLVLDTVDLDVRGPKPDSHRLTLIWRGIVTAPGRFETASIDGIRLKR